MAKVKDSQSQSGEKMVGLREIRSVLISKPRSHNQNPTDQREAIWE